MTTDHWHFGVSPEIGIILPLQSRVAWYLKARYNYAAKAGNFTHQWFGFGIGIGIGFGFGFGFAGRP